MGGIDSAGKSAGRVVRDQKPGIGDQNSIIPAKAGIQKNRLTRSREAAKNTKAPSPSRGGLGWGWGSDVRDRGSDSVGAGFKPALLVSREGRKKNGVIASKAKQSRETFRPLPRPLSRKRERGEKHVPRSPRETGLRAGRPRSFLCALCVLCGNSFGFCDFAQNDSYFFRGFRVFRGLKAFLLALRVSA
jgi:hypothetical protein